MGGCRAGHLLRGVVGHGGVVVLKNLFYLFVKRKADERAKLMRNLRKSVFRCVDFVVPIKADMD